MYILYIDTIYLNVYSGFFFFFLISKLHKFIRFVCLFFKKKIQFYLPCILVSRIRPLLNLGTRCRLKFKLSFFLQPYTYIKYSSVIWMCLVSKCIQAKNNIPVDNSLTDCGYWVKRSSNVLYGGCTSFDWESNCNKL